MGAMQFIKHDVEWFAEASQESVLRHTQHDISITVPFATLNLVWGRRFESHLCLFYHSHSSSPILVACFSNKLALVARAVDL